MAKKNKLLFISLVLWMAYPFLAQANEEGDITATEYSFACQAYQKEDWLTLIKVTREFYLKQKEELLIEKLLDWTQTTVTRKKTVSGARHLSTLYKEMKNGEKSFFWKKMAEKWLDEEKEKNLKY